MILILEASGRRLVGLARGLEAAGHQVEVAHDVDVGSMKAVRAAVFAVKPSAVILTGGLDDPLACEEDPARAFVLNAEGAIHLAAAAMEVRAVPILISSPAVLGDAGREHGEDAAPDPTTTYGRSKLQGESFLARAAKSGLVIRAGHVLEDGLGMERGRLDEGAVEASEREPVSPIGAADLGTAIDRLLAVEASGVIHAASPDTPVSELELWRAIAEACGASVDWIAASSRRGGASLLCGRLERSGVKLRPWRDALADAAGREIQAAPEPVRRLGPGEALTGHGPAELEVRSGKVVVEERDTEAILKPGRRVRVEAAYRVVAIDPAEVIVRSAGSAED